MRMDACEDVAAPRLCTPPPLPKPCLRDPRVNPYLPDTIASLRVPCCCSWTTPHSALPVDAPHGRARRPTDPQTACPCHHLPEDRPDVQIITPPAPCPFAHWNGTAMIDP